MKEYDIDELTSIKEEEEENADFLLSPKFVLKNCLLFLLDNILTCIISIHVPIRSQNKVQ